MYYLELIQRFWTYNQNAQVGSTAVAMYLYLLKTAYSNGHYDFTISDVAISRDLGLSRNTVITTKGRLRKLRLIDFKTKNGLPCRYRMIINYPIDNSGQLELLKINMEESINDKTSLDIKMAEDIGTEANVSSCLNGNSSKENAIVPSKDILPLKMKMIIPEIEEYLEYAKTLDGYDSTLEFKIRKKYSEWLEKGWCNNAKRPITNWKSSLKSALPFLLDSNLGKTLYEGTIPKIRRPQYPSDKNK
ncbi:hypothetical protein [Chryseobacterium turcicum]|uniref:Uncharacterized protein n=1 Tax=Chryseobacterium turcicum TaxID=2898076 RepID=A0A9Q3V4G2_9FLAO|nr:hypothetical protein [Chryseobacterium turcicum]MCD1117533.1 hypothetical protein [Chryseobacterium turcicum]